MATIVVSIPDLYLTPIAQALRPHVPNEAEKDDAAVIETYARNIIAGLVVQHAGSLAVAAIDAQREAARQTAMAEAQAMMDAVLAADEA